MKTKQLLTSTAIAMLMAGSTLAADAAAREAMTPNLAVRSQALTGQTLIVESLGSAVAVDLYKLTCFTHSMSADVNDIGPFEDTKFQVLVVGSGGGIAGKASVRVGPTGGLSGVASVNRGGFFPFQSNGSLLGYVLITEADGPGAENYDSLMTCRRANLGSTINPTIVKLLDQ